MNSRLRSAVGGLLACLGLLLIAVPSAHAVAVALPNTYEFSANCTECAHTAGTTDYPVYGQLILTPSYVLGMTIAPNQFVSFTYDGSNLLPAFMIYNPMFPPPGPPVPNEFAGTLLSGALPATLPGPPSAEILLRLVQDPDFTVQIYPDGVWSMGSSADFGNAATFSVPEPSTWAMLLIGFAGLAYAGRRSAQVRSRALAA